MADDALEQWKNKYYNSLDALEKLEQDWAQMGSTISRAVIRIAMATEGLDPSLDDYLKDVSVVLREGAIDEKVAKRMDMLSSAIIHAKKQEKKRVPNNPPATENKQDPHARLRLFTRLLDRIPAPPGQEKKIKRLRKVLSQDPGKKRNAAIKEILLTYGNAYQNPAATSATQSSHDKTPEDGKTFLKRIFKSVADAEKKPTDEVPTQDVEVRDVLLELIDGLFIPPGFHDRLNEIKSGLETPEATDQSMAVVTELITLTLEIQKQTALEKSELESFLSHITQRLQTLDKSLDQEIDGHHALLSEEAKLNDAVSDHVAHIRSSIAGATDVTELKDVIQTRLENIQERMQAFRHFGGDQAAQAESRIKAMNDKIQSLEQETAQLKKTIACEHKKAMLDALTQVPNRLAYDTELHKEYNRWKRHKEPLSMIVWDIDFFKKVNDTYGHQAGDNALKFIASILAKRVRETDFLARFGGEEFVTLLTKTTQEEAEIFANSVRETVAKAAFRYDDQKVAITISGGISEFKKGDKQDTPFARADQALYQSKQNGRNRVTIH